MSMFSIWSWKRFPGKVPDTLSNTLEKHHLPNTIYYFGAIYEGTDKVSVKSKCQGLFNSMKLLINCLESSCLFIVCKMAPLLNCKWFRKQIQYHVGKNIQYQNLSRILLRLLLRILYQLYGQDLYLVVWFIVIMMPLKSRNVSQAILFFNQSL